MHLAGVTGEIREMVAENRQAIRQTKRMLELIAIVGGCGRKARWVKAQRFTSRSERETDSGMWIRRWESNETLEP